MAGSIVSGVAVATVPVTPSPLWFTTRGAGVMTLVILTAVVVLGIATSLRWEGRAAPRFVTAALHRNLGLFAVVLLAVHIATSVLDPFAGIRWTDAVIPFAGAYRTAWLGLGVLAAEALVAVAVTSVARHRLGPRTWRLVHWIAYASWPLAVVHGLGTGSDARQPWLVGLTAACVAAVVLALGRRLLAGTWRSVPIRVAGAVVVGLALTATWSWALRGPFQPGWAAVAGTPVTATAAASPAPPPSARSGFADALVGTMAQAPAGAEIAFRDVVDPALILTVVPPGPNETLPVLTVSRNGTRLCTAPVRAVTTMYAECGSTRLVIQLFGDATHLTGRLITSGPL
jgi:methionine sulfoxide reductase heme-binding subunit